MQEHGLAQTPSRKRKLAQLLLEGGKLQEALVALREVSDSSVLGSKHIASG